MLEMKIMSKKQVRKILENYISLQKEIEEEKSLSSQNLKQKESKKYGVADQFKLQPKEHANSILTIYALHLVYFDGTIKRFRKEQKTTKLTPFNYNHKNPRIEVKITDIPNSLNDLEALLKAGVVALVNANKTNIGYEGIPVKYSK